jgi:hypothetical protein
MPTIAFKDFNDYLSRIAAADWPAVTLVCGEELLCKKASTLSMGVKTRWARFCRA